MYPVRRIERMEHFASAARSCSVFSAATTRRRGLAIRLCPMALIASDIAAFVLAVFLAFIVDNAARPSPFARAIGNLLQLGPAWHGWGTFLVLVSLLGSFAACGHYTSRIPFWTQLGDVIMGCAIALACDTFLTSAVYGRPVEVEGLLRWIFYCPCLLLLRSGVRQVLQFCDLWTIKTLIVAPPGVHDQTRAALQSDAAMGYAIVGSMELSEAATLDDDRLRELMYRCGAEFVVVAIGTGNIAAERTVIGTLRRTRCPIGLVPALEGLPVVGLRQHYFFSHDIVMLVSHNNLARPFSRILKIAFDQLVAAILLVVFAPLMLLLAFLIRMDGGSALYRHRRIGAGGQVFDCLKFRTMVSDAEHVLHRVLLENPAAAAEWEATQKLRDDPRITPVGRFLRRSSLDELPQLLNVLRGEMSSRRTATDRAGGSHPLWREH